MKSLPTLIPGYEYDTKTIVRICLKSLLRRRKEVYVRSRGPIPAVVSGVMNMVIVTNIFVQVGDAVVELQAPSPFDKKEMVTPVL